EDGIRDLYVTGVQTCALPISRQPATPLSARLKRRDPKLEIRRSEGALRAACAGSAADRQLMVEAKGGPRGRWIPTGERVGRTISRRDGATRTTGTGLPMTLGCAGEPVLPEKCTHR